MNELDQKVYREQIRLIYAQGPVLVLGAALCAIIISLYLWRHLPQNALFLWLGAITLTTVLRMWVILTFQRISEADRERRHWGVFFWIGTLSAGLIWGAWPLMFYSVYDADHLLLISAVFAAMVAVSAASGNIYLPSFLSFSVPLIMPMAVAHLLSGDGVLAVTGVLLLVFLAVNYFLASRGSLQYRELIRSRFEKQVLLEQLEAEKRIADRAVIAKSRFLAAASHDMRQPLHAMGLFLRALRNRESDPKQLRIIDGMSMSSDSLSGLFNSLLDVSRLDAEIIEFLPTHVLVEELFDGLRAQFVQQCANKDIELAAQSRDCVVYTDAILFGRVLRNLLSNAVRYTSHGQVDLSCEEASDGSKIITVQDTGIGIPQEELEEVFSEYYQLNNPERDRGKGLGLGLSIVRRLCDLMGLQISLHSEVNQGTQFRISVPAGDPTQVLKSKESSTPFRVQEFCVLLIDDEQQVLSGTRHLLEGWGCEVILANTVREALGVIALYKSTPDLVLSDYRLRDSINGVDAVAAIREALEYEVPAVIVTGDASPERFKEVIKAGLLLLHKPVPPDELQQLLSHLWRKNLEISETGARRERALGNNVESSPRPPPAWAPRT
ncbi:MAG: ATP-binding protein [Granulosicoccus sp.]